MVKSFEKWMAAVDRIFNHNFGMESNHFPDWCWWDAFESGATPREAFEEYVEDEGLMI